MPGRNLLHYKNSRKNWNHETGCCDEAKCNSKRKAIWRGDEWVADAGKLFGTYKWPTCIMENRKGTWLSISVLSTRRKRTNAWSHYYEQCLYHLRKPLDIHENFRGATLSHKVVWMWNVRDYDVACILGCSQYTCKQICWSLGWCGWSCRVSEKEKPEAARKTGRNIIWTTTWG